MSIDYSIFDSLQDSVIVVDSEFRVYYANQSMSNLLNVSVNRLRNGKTLSEFIIFASPICLKSEFPIGGFSPMKEIEFTTTTQKKGSLQVNLQIDTTTRDLPKTDKRWIAFFRDVSLEKILHKKYVGELDQKEEVIQKLKNAQVQLEDYSKNLELKVEARTTELRKSNTLLSAILDSLDQGIIVFERTGFILPYHSKMCRKIFKGEIKNRNLVNLISKRDSIRKQIRDWISVVFEEPLDFQDLKGLGPSKLGIDVTESEIALEYNPMRDSEGKIQAVVMVATDKTNEMRAKREADHERAQVKRLVQITKYRSQFRSFAQDAVAILARMIRDLQGIKANELDVELFARDLHTFKGGAATFALSELTAQAHEAEKTLFNFTKSKKKNFNLLLESITDLQFEFNLFLEKNKELFGEISANGAKQIEVSSETALRWLNELKSIKGTKNIHKEIEDLFVHEKIGSFFAYLDESLSDLANSLGKKLKPLKIKNGDLRIEAKHYRELFAVLIHVFRNAIDHGLEEPELRSQNGKDESGLIQIHFEMLEADEASRQIRIIISDDGAGIDAKLIRKRMKKLGYSAHESKLSDHKVLQCVFDESFTSREQLSEMSGRGVGLFAVKTVVLGLGGSIEVKSHYGKGSQFVIEVPFIVSSGQNSFEKVA